MTDGVLIDCAGFEPETTAVRLCPSGSEANLVCTDIGAGQEPEWRDANGAKLPKCDGTLEPSRFNYKAVPS